MMTEDNAHALGWIAGPFLYMLIHFAIKYW